MTKRIRTQLSVMMFLQFFIWGAWFVSLGTFLKANLAATGDQSAAVFSTQSWGAIIAPFIIGLIADRYFNAERILGVLHLTGAALLFLMYQAPDVDVFYPYTLAYMVLYMPTIALANSVAFRQMQNPDTEFSGIRVLGTIGWIIAGLMISFVFMWDSTAATEKGALKNTFLLAASASLLLGLFSFRLPKTTPVKKKSDKVSIPEILGLDALKLLADRNYLIFFLASIFICIPLAFYYQITHDFLSSLKIESPTALMSIGQASEAIFLLLLPLFFKKFGFKKTILAGMLAWVLRYVLFAYGDAGGGFWLLLTGIALHGICYDFFFVSGYIYTNQRAGEQYKSSAQGLITLATYGVGMFIGFEIAGLVSDHYTDASGINYKKIWLMPAGIAAIVFLFFALLFSEKDTNKKQNIASRSTNGE